jgi:hypothetical protein
VNCQQPNGSPQHHVRRLERIEVREELRPPRYLDPDIARLRVLPVPKVARGDESLPKPTYFGAARTEQNAPPARMREPHACAHYQRSWMIQGVKHGDRYRVGKMRRQHLA